MPAREVLGSITPRLYTPPLVPKRRRRGPCGCGCNLTPATSYGFEVARWAEEELGRPLWPWQRWLVIHAGELNPDGTPRFRRVIVTVGRQSGKTEVVLVLTLYWLFVERRASVLGTSTLTKYAKKPWFKAFDVACFTPKLRERMPENPRRKAIRKAAGEEEWWTAEGCHYAIAASNSEGGRSMTNDRVIADELAKQYNYDAYGAAYFSMDAVENAQYFGLTTPDAKGVVYNDLRDSALAFIDTGEGDPTLGLFEWSAPDRSAPTDPRALACANPTINRPGGKRLARVLNEAAAAAAAATTGSGELLRTFQTEVMCMQVADIDLAIDPERWEAAGAEPGPIVDRTGVVLVFDVALSLQHATLYAAAPQPDGTVRIEAVEAWQGPGCVDRAAGELPALVKRVKPKAFGWLPSGPAAAVGSRLADRNRPGRKVWPPPGVKVEEIRGELTQVCMGLAALVDAGRIRHSADPLLDAQVAAAVKSPRGDGWVFTRKGEGDTDAVYAAAGAAHLAQTAGPGVGRIRILLPTVG
jgi:phage terminase large subunit-like protein